MAELLDHDPQSDGQLCGEILTRPASREATCRLRPPPLHVSYLFLSEPAPRAVPRPGPSHRTSTPALSGPAAGAECPRCRRAGGE